MSVEVICEVFQGVPDDPEVFETEAAAAEAIIEKLANQGYFKKEPQPLKNRSKYAMKLYTMYGDEKDGADYEIRRYPSVEVK